MKITNKLGLPQPIVDAVSNDDYDRGPANISVTGLLAPPRQRALLEAYGADLEEDASDRIFSLFGKAIHAILENQKPGADVREQRLFMRVPAPLGEWVVSGAMDRIALLPQADGTIVIQDYKTASVAEMIYGVKAERAQQLNIYRALAELNGYKVGRLEAVFILRDWSKVTAADAAERPTLASDGENGSTYPATHVIVHEVEIWPIEETYRFIAERVALHQGAQFAYERAREYVEARDEPALMPQDVLPECDDEERWSRGKTYAAMKTDGKRASKTGTEEDMVAWIASTKKPGDYSVIERPGRSLRCMFYCACAPICDQWKAIRDAG